MVSGLVWQHMCVAYLSWSIRLCKSTYDSSDRRKCLKTVSIHVVIADTRHSSPTLHHHTFSFADSFTDLVSRLQIIEEKSEGAPILNIVKGLPPPLEGVERCLSIDEEAIKGEEPWELLSRD